MKINFYTLLSVLLFIPFVSNAQLNNFSAGDAAPDFTVTDIHGQTHTLSDYSGKWEWWTYTLIGVDHVRL